MFLIWCEMSESKPPTDLLLLHTLHSYNTGKQFLVCCWMPTQVTDVELSSADHKVIGDWLWI